MAVLLAPVNIFAQSKPKPVEASMLESYGLYLGVVAALGLVGLVAFVRKKKQDEAEAKPAAKPDVLRMTYRENREKSGAKEREAEKVKPEEAPKPAGPQVNNFSRLRRANPFTQLPESLDPALLTAIDQTNEDWEEDVQVRAQALKLLSTFKNSNTVAAIAQMAVYDLSSKLRSDAVGVLADLDHESVFETLVTACADPTREVRAAAAKALFKLSFDRGLAWTRIIEAGDVGRMRHAARCAIEGGLVQRSFDRLTHPDQTVAYEAFALVALLVRAGETEPIFKVLAAHRDENVKLTILNVLQLVKEECTFEELTNLLEKHTLTPNIAAKVNEVRSSMQMSHA